MNINKIHTAVNWNVKNDTYTQMFWEQNVKQFWVDTEIPVSKDFKSWNLLTDQQKDVYKKVLAGLTLLDTKQSNSGMPFIAEKVEDKQRKAVLYFMGMMEQIHAKSYSTIFTTLLIKEEIEELFEWVKENKFLQKKADLIDNYYTNIKNKKDLYMAMVASVFLESFLFYSGFFYPLYLAGQGRMVNSGEIINLIVRDESIHGVYVGLLAQELYNELSENDKKKVDIETLTLLDCLMDNENSYTEEIYSTIELDHDVKKFVRYNANKALMNLGKEPIYKEEEVNPIVLNGLNTETKTHDFFSTKGNGYQKGKVEYLRDEDFVFEWEVNK